MIPSMQSHSTTLLSIGSQAGYFHKMTTAVAPTFPSISPLLHHGAIDYKNVYTGLPTNVYATLGAVMHSDLDCVHGGQRVFKLQCRELPGQQLPIVGTGNFHSLVQSLNVTQVGLECELEEVRGGRGRGGER